jgi:hypothetical protein
MKKVYPTNIFLVCIVTSQLRAPAVWRKPTRVLFLRRYVTMDAADSHAGVHASWWWWSAGRAVNRSPGTYCWVRGTEVLAHTLQHECAQSDEMPLGWPRTTLHPSLGSSPKGRD